MRQKDLLPHVIWLQFCYQRISEFGEWKHAVRLLLTQIPIPATALGAGQRLPVVLHHVLRQVVAGR